MAAASRARGSGSAITAAYSVAVDAAPRSRLQDAAARWRSLRASAPKPGALLDARQALVGARELDLVLTAARMSIARRKSSSAC